MKCAVGYCRNPAVVHLSVGPGDGKPMRYTGLSCLPARTDQKWYRALEFDPDTYIKHLGRRVAFRDPTGGGRMSPREGAMAAVTFGLEGGA